MQLDECSVDYFEKSQFSNQVKIGYSGHAGCMRSDTPSFQEGSRVQSSPIQGCNSNMLQQCIGQIIFEKSGLQINGSATLISPMHILTPAHNVIGQTSKQVVPAEDLQFCLTNGKKCKISCIFYDQGQLADWIPSSNIAILQLEKPVGLQQGYLGLIGSNEDSDKLYNQYSVLQKKNHMLLLKYDEANEQENLSNQETPLPASIKSVGSTAINQFQEVYALDINQEQLVFELGQEPCGPYDHPLIVYDQCLGYCVIGLHTETNDSCGHCLTFSSLKVAAITQFIQKNLKDQLIMKERGEAITEKSGGAGVLTVEENNLVFPRSVASQSCWNMSSSISETLMQNPRKQLQMKKASGVATSATTATSTATIITANSSKSAVAQTEIDSDAKVNTAAAATVVVTSDSKQSLQINDLCRLNNTYLASCSQDQQLVIWNYQTNSIVKTIKTDVCSMRMAQFGRLLAATNDKYIILLDWVKLKVETVIPCKQSQTAILFLSQQLLVSGDKLGFINIFHLEANNYKQLKVLQNNSEFSSEISAITNINQNIIFVGNYQGVVRVWDWNESQNQPIIEFPPRQLGSNRQGQQQQLLKNSSQTFSQTSTTVKHQSEESFSQILWIKIYCDILMIMASSNNRLTVWEITQQQCVKQFNVKFSRSCSFQMLNDYEIAFIDESEQVSILNIQTEKISKMETKIQEISAFCLLNTGPSAMCFGTKYGDTYLAQWKAKNNLPLLNLNNQSECNLEEWSSFVSERFEKVNMSKTKNVTEFSIDFTSLSSPISKQIKLSQSKSMAAKQQLGGNFQPLQDYETFGKELIAYNDQQQNIKKDQPREIEVKYDKQETTNMKERPQKEQQSLELKQEENNSYRSSNAILSNNHSMKLSTGVSYQAIEIGREELSQISDQNNTKEESIEQINQLVNTINNLIQKDVIPTPIQLDSSNNEYKKIQFIKLPKQEQQQQIENIQIQQFGSDSNEKQQQSKNQQDKEYPKMLTNLDKSNMLSVDCNEVSKASPVAAEETLISVDDCSTVSKDDYVKKMESMIQIQKQQNVKLLQQNQKLVEIIQSKNAEKSQVFSLVKMIQDKMQGYSHQITVLHEEKQKLQTQINQMQDHINRLSKPLNNSDCQSEQRASQEDSEQEQDDVFKLKSIIEMKDKDFLSKEKKMLEIIMDIEQERASEKEFILTLKNQLQQKTEEVERLRQQQLPLQATQRCNQSMLQDSSRQNSIYQLLDSAKQGVLNNFQKIQEDAINIVDVGWNEFNQQFKTLTQKYKKL